jgi:DNA ligase-1
MEYSLLAKTYAKLESTSKRLEKTYILSDLLKKTPDSELEKVLYLVQGKVFPAYDERKIGFSVKLAIRAIASATGIPIERVEKEFAKKGDLGIVTEELTKGKKQTTLFHKKITVEKVFDNIRKLSTLEGQGTINRKIQLVTELLTSASPEESKYIIRTIVEQLRIGISAGILRDAIAWAYFPRVKGINDKDISAKSILKPKSLKDIENKDLKKYQLIDSGNEKLNRQIYNYFIQIVQQIFDIKNDYAAVAKAIKEQGIKSKQEIKPGTPINSMLAIKVNTIKDAFEALGKPLFFDNKIDGFRLQCHKSNKEIKLFTRRLENVTKQFSDLVKILKSHIKADSFIIDSEAVGFDPKTKKLMPFQAISQRIKRKYNIEQMIKELPVQLFVFDIIYYNGKDLMQLPFKQRRKILEKVVKQEPHKIQLTEKIITDSEKEAEKFYKKVLRQGYEGLIAKNLNAPYKPGRYVGGWVKLKPTLEPLDLTIPKAYYGEGKRAGWLTSYTLACKSGNKLLEIGKVSTGVKEKGEGFTYQKMTKLLKPLIIKQKGKEVILKPKIVIEVGYEEIQKSPNYSSGFALRFPRFIRERTDKSINELTTLEEVKTIYKNQKKLTSKKRN